jgi:tripartite-type tricarboxylate transporter receptor subunit TctC
MTCVTRLAGCAGIALSFAVAPATFAQAYPARPVRVVVGPGQDLVARLVGQKLTVRWRQQVIVDPRPGGGGANAADIAGKAAADGYTWLLSTAVFTINPALYAKPPYDLVRDFDPVALWGTATFLLVVHPSVPAKSVAELIQLARQKPGQINYSSAGVGTPPHLAGEMLKSMAHVNLFHVPYKSVAATIPDLLSGQVQMSFQFAPTALPYVRNGKLRGLAVTSAKRSLIAPELPTVAESGLPGFEVVGWNGVHVPRGTPRAVIGRINADTLEVIRIPELQERMLTMGFEPAETTPEEFARFVRTDVARWTKVIKDAGIQPE